MAKVVGALAAAILGVFLSAALVRANEEASFPGSAQQATKEATAASAPVAVPEPSELAMQYYRSGGLLWVVYRFVDFLIPAVVLFTGFAASLRNLAQRLGRKWIFVVILFFVLYTLLDFVVQLPLSYYSGYVRQHAYGLSNQTLAKWIGNALKQLCVSLVSGALVVWAPYLLIRKSPKRWWLYTGLLAIPFMFFVALVVPVWIDPLFNDFSPMQDKQLEAKILALAERAGIEGSRVFEVNKSVDTKTVNAYVTGFMSTKRIVLWDTLLAKLDEDEVLTVMAHEMGHYALNHVFWTILAGSGTLLAGLYLVHLAATIIVRRFHQRLGFTELSDVASLPLILLLVGIVSLALTPPMLVYSRHNEREADRFGLELTRDNHAAATAFVKLQQENLSNPRPGPLYTIWRGTHPSIAERIAFFNAYCPWETGEPQRYQRYFVGPATSP